MASGSTPSTSISTTRNCATTRRWRRSDAQRLDGTGVNPYNIQEHLYDKNRPENIGFLKRFRALLDEFPAIGRGRRGRRQPARLEIVGEYTAGGDKMHMCYAFDFLAPDPLTPEVRAGAERLQAAAAPMAGPAGPSPTMTSCAMSAASRNWADRAMSFAKLRSRHPADDAARLGLPLSGRRTRPDRKPISLEDLQDPYGIRFWPAFKGRDGCRTPMVWDSQRCAWRLLDRQALAAGPGRAHLRKRSACSRATRIRCSSITAASRLPRSHPAFAKGEIELHGAVTATCSLPARITATSDLCVFNMSGDRRKSSLPTGTGRRLTGHGFGQQ
jgi:alpha-glucosidase